MDRIVGEARTRYLARAERWSQPLTEYLFQCGKDPCDGVDYLTGWAMCGIENCLQELAGEAGWSWGLILSLTRGYEPLDPKSVETRVRTALGCDRVPELAWLLAGMGKLRRDVQFLQL